MSDKDITIAKQNQFIDELVAENIYLRTKLNIYEECEKNHQNAWENANKKVMGERI